MLTILDPFILLVKMTKPLLLNKLRLILCILYYTLQALNKVYLAKIF